MKARTVAGISAAVVLMLVPQMALAAYTSIQHNLQYDGIPDTTFDGSVLRIQQVPANDLTLYVDGNPQGGAVTEASVDLWTTLHHFDPVGLDPEHKWGTAVFTGGAYTLRFKWNGSSDFYELSGPISGLQIGVTSGSMFASTMTGEARWTATTKNLPISTWDDQGGYSSLHALTLYFAKDLRGFQWNSPIAGAGDTLYNVEPNDAAIPEPAALVLLALGALGLVRRRVC